MFAKKFLTSVVLSVCLSGAVAAEDRTVAVHFPASSTGTTLRDTVIGRDAVLYRVGAEAGQNMSVALRSSNLATYFNIYPPGRGLGDEALASGQFTDPVNSWSGVLPTSGDYTIAVYLYRAAARRGERSDFTLDISVAGETGDVVQSDYADGLAGGPDFYAVSVTGGGTLNLRSEPTAEAAVVTRLANGQNVRNLGCRMAEGRRWCRVATLADPGIEGWAAGDFLIEGTGQTATASGSGAERVRFAAGTTGTELTATLAPGESRRYIIGTNANQFLYVRVAPRGQPISYQIFNPDNSFLLDQISSDKEYRGQLWQSGDHVIEVINRTNENATYNLILGIE